MTDQGAHDRETFEVQGSAFLRQNISDKPEFDYAENRPPRSYALAGATLTLAVRGAPTRYRHQFSDDQVTIEDLSAAVCEARRVTTSYEAFEMAPNIFFVSYLADPLHSVAMALDLVTGVATVVMGEMTDGGIVIECRCVPGGGVHRAERRGRSRAALSRAVQPGRHPLPQHLRPQRGLRAHLPHRGLRDLAGRARPAGRAGRHRGVPRLQDQPTASICSTGTRAC